VLKTLGSNVPGVRGSCGPTGELDAVRVHWMPAGLCAKHPDPGGWQPGTYRSMIRDYFDIWHSFIGVSAAILIGFVCTFTAVMALSLRYLNFQKR
jgi:hypothetical protein